MKWNNLANEKNGEKKSTGESFLTDENFDITGTNQNRGISNCLFKLKSD